MTLKFSPLIHNIDRVNQIQIYGSSCRILSGYEEMFKMLNNLTFIILIRCKIYYAKHVCLRHLDFYLIIVTLIKRVRECVGGGENSDIYLQ
jgi:hypothetical protein